MSNFTTRYEDDKTDERLEMAEFFITIIVLLALAAGLIYFLAWPSKAAAEPQTGGPLFSPFINSRVILVDGIYILSPELSLKQARELHKTAIKKWWKSGVLVRKGKFRAIWNDPFETFSSSRYDGDLYGDPYLAEASYWNARLRKNKKLKRFHVTYIFTPPWRFGGNGPWHDGSRSRFGGYSIGGPKMGCVSVGSAAEFSFGGTPVLGISQVLTDHELGHCLGASDLYDSRCSTMDAGALQCVEPGQSELPILSSSIEEIGRATR